MTPRERKELRVELGVTQHAMSRLAGLTVATIQRAEAPGTRCAAETLSLIDAALLDVEEHGLEAAAPPEPAERVAPFLARCATEGPLGGQSSLGGATPVLVAGRLR